MSAFHSTLSRRDFMKAVGLAGAGIGAASAASPVFHDLDEASQIGGVAEKRPWYVRELEYAKPTVEIDWNMIQRQTHYNNWEDHLDQTEKDSRAHMYYDNTKKMVLENNPGNTMFDVAIRHPAWTAVRRNMDYFFGVEGIIKDTPPGFEMGFDPESGHCMMSPVWATDLFGIITPGNMGVPRWEGTPEQNAALIRMAARWCGGAEVGYLKADEYTKKLVHKTCGILPILADKNGREVVWENVDQPYETDKKLVIPEKCDNIIVVTIREERNPALTAPSYRADATTAKSYARSIAFDIHFRGFLHAIGYTSAGSGWGPWNNVPFGVLSGIGELGRMRGQITPSCGPLIRKVEVFFTDLPLPPTNPIDFGANRFCRDCGLCAKACPASAIPTFREPTYDITPADDANSNPTKLHPEYFNLSGKKVWPNNDFACHNFWVTSGKHGCAACVASCVFSKDIKSSIHEVVKGVVSQTGMFNGFFANMDHAFGYGIVSDQDMWNNFWFEPDKYWPLEGIDTNL
ncbi:dehalogenase [Dehalococcoides mccartyi CG1]|uniref:reductive dehalogenase n=1 Tax=Dehalococcoides mccartyi TaxID=61435 RepID=UPI0004E08230|nr:reductive dehalogenase [Dehalococcoides mccartyi]AII57310.1 dehalogenase [Dehalococcoides mccartyi CG1]